MKVTDKYVFFWDGIYSQWYQSPMTIDGITYVTAEQYMMHQKALLFGDTEIADKILLTSHPRDQKELGRSVKNFDKTKWDESCFDIVLKGNINKFSQNEELKNEILSTGDRKFCEASPFDLIWGCGLGENNPLIDDEINWIGKNLLGKVLDKVKQEILNELKQETKG